MSHKRRRKKMARKNKCGRLGKIAKRVNTSRIKCCKFDIMVTIEVLPQGNRCLKEDCPHNKGFIEKEET
jgi:hypothetical protein